MSRRRLKIDRAITAGTEWNSATGQVSRPVCSSRRNFLTRPGLHRKKADASEAAGLEASGPNLTPQAPVLLISSVTF